MNHVANGTTACEAPSPGVKPIRSIYSRTGHHQAKMKHKKAAHIKPLAENHYFAKPNPHRRGPPTTNGAGTGPRRSRTVRIQTLQTGTSLTSPALTPKQGSTTSRKKAGPAGTKPITYVNYLAFPGKGKLLINPARAAPVWLLFSVVSLNITQKVAVRQCPRTGPLPPSTNPPFP